MNHPDQETWIAYLYRDGLSPARKAELAAHLASCTLCQDQMNSWLTVRQGLDSWTLRPTPARSGWPRQWLRLAATLVVLAAGIALGRSVLSPPPDLAAVREHLREELASELRSDFAETLATAQADQRAEFRLWLADLASTQEQRRRQDLAAVQNALVQLDSQRQSDNASLRRDMETVAILTDASFRQTHEQLVRVASVAGGTPTEIVP